ncbi:MAG: hypothetical protein GY725_15565 [bacterium]|nr:hypothetical protein [bacterium]
MGSVRYMMFPVVFSLVLTSSSPVRGQAQTTAYGVPISNMDVHGSLHLPDDEVATFTVREGTLLTVERRRDFVYAFAPALGEDRDGSTVIAWLPMLIENDPRGSVVTQLGDTAPVSRPVGRSTSIATEHGEFKFTVSEILLGEPLPEAYQRPVRPDRAGSGRCCVRQADWTLCSNSDVEWSSGADCSTTFIRTPQ